MVSTVIATLFLRTTLHSTSVSDGQTYLGLIFFAIIHMVCRKLPCTCSLLLAVTFKLPQLPSAPSVPSAACCPDASLFEFLHAACS